MAGVLTEIRSLTGVFFSWWLGELEAMWRPLRRAFSRGPDTLSLSTSGQQWIFRLHKGSRVQELGRLDCQSQANVGRKTVGTIMKRANLRHADLTLLLAQDRTLRKRLDMPLIAEPDLRQALYFEIDRQTPFRPDDVYFDYRVLVRRPETKRVMVELTAVPRATVDKILGQVHDWGLQPSIVDVAADNAQDGVGINLLTGLEGHRLSGRWPLLSVASVLLLIGLVAAVLYIPVGQLSANGSVTIGAGCAGKG